MSNNELTVTPAMLSKATGGYRKRDLQKPGAVSDQLRGFLAGNGRQPPSGATILTKAGNEQAAADESVPITSKGKALSAWANLIKHGQAVSPCVTTEAGANWFLAEFKNERATASAKYLAHLAICYGYSRAQIKRRGESKGPGSAWPAFFAMPDVSGNMAVAVTFSEATVSKAIEADDDSFDFEMDDDAATKAADQAAKAATKNGK